MPFNYQRPGAAVDSADEKHGDGDSPDVDGCSLLPESPPTDGPQASLLLPGHHFKDRRLSSSGRRRHGVKWDRGVHAEDAVRAGRRSSTAGDT